MYAVRFQLADPFREETHVVWQRKESTGGLTSITDWNRQSLGMMMSHAETATAGGQRCEGNERTQHTPCEHGNGMVKSRSERDRKISTILRKCGVKLFILVKRRENLAFTVMESASVGKSEASDGYQIYVTTEKVMSDADIVDAYRSRDRI